MTISILIMRVGLHLSSDKLDQISVDFKAKRVSTLRYKDTKVYECSKTADRTNDIFMSVDSYSKPKGYTMWVILSCGIVIKCRVLWPASRQVCVLNTLDCWSHLTFKPFWYRWNSRIKNYVKEKVSVIKRMVKSSDAYKVKDSSVRAVRLTHCNYGIDYIV